MDNELREHLGKLGISNPEEPTESEFRKILNLLPDELDEILIEGYYKIIDNALPGLMKMMDKLSSQSLAKDVIKSYQSRLDVLNERWTLEEDPKVREEIQIECSEIYDRIENESDKHRNWLSGFAKTMGSIVIIGGLATVGIKYKDTGKKIIDAGVKSIKGWSSIT